MVNINEGLRGILGDIYKYYKSQSHSKFFIVSKLLYIFFYNICKGYIPLHAIVSTQYNFYVNSFCTPVRFIFAYYVVLFLVD